jgi:DegV family protein with EDD domain
MGNDSIQQLNGKNLYYSFLSGAKKIIEHQKELNKLNFFPVPDADTGTNMASTIRSVIERIKPHRSYKVTADAIALAALDGARGNSGVIFAQFLYGMSAETLRCEKITIERFAESVQRSVQYIYDAIADPIEGTILTVIREWADFIYANKNKLTDFSHLLSQSVEVANVSLQGTAKNIRNLSKPTVDAGAKGFVLFLEGILEWIKWSNIRTITDFSKEHSLTDEAEITDDTHETFNFRYCTEAMIKDCSLGIKEIRELVTGMGDSLVVAGSPKLIRLHIHTNKPQEIFTKLGPYGTLAFQKADDMQKQYEAAHHRKWNIALVTDSACDLSPEQFDFYQINIVPLNIFFGDNHYLDKVTITPDHFYHLLNKSKKLPTTSQPNEKTFANLYSHLLTHYDSVIAVHLSKNFSGTYNSSRLAAEKISAEMGKKITVIDSETLTGSLGLLTLRVAKAIEGGMPHDEIVAQTDNWKKKASILVSVKSIKNMIKGGRLSPMKGLFANLLNLKPIVSGDGKGNLRMLDKTFSQSSNMRRVIAHAKKLIAGHKTWGYLVLHAQNLESTDYFISEMEKLTGMRPLAIIDTTPIIGLHSDEKALAIALMIE